VCTGYCIEHSSVSLAYCVLQEIGPMLTLKEKVISLNNAMAKMEETISKLERNQKLHQENLDITLQTLKSDMKEMITKIPPK